MSMLGMLQQSIKARDVNAGAGPPLGIKGKCQRLPEQDRWTPDGCWPQPQRSQKWTEPGPIHGVRFREAVGGVVFAKHLRRRLPIFDQLLGGVAAPLGLFREGGMDARARAICERLEATYEWLAYRGERNGAHRFDYHCGPHVVQLSIRGTPITGRLRKAMEDVSTCSLKERETINHNPDET